MANGGLVQIERLIGKVCGVGTAGMLLVASSASAGPITWQHIYDASPNVYFAQDGSACSPNSIAAACESLTYLHDLTTDGFVPGLLSLDQITGGTLEIAFLDDDNDPGNQAEKVKIDLDGLALGGTEPGAQTFTLGSFTLAVLTSLQLDGILNVTLRHQAGDFYFDQSTLTADGTRQIQDDGTPGGGDIAVPEPGTLVLFGAGVLGALARARQRRRGHA
jgi:hypothetical protein